MTGKQEDGRGEKNIRIELMVAFNNFNGKIMRPSCQSSFRPKFMKSRYKRGKLIRKITMKIFIAKVKES